MIFSKYIIKTLAIATSMVTFVLTFLIWIEQSLRFMEFLAKRNMDLVDFIAFISHLLPDLFGAVLPFAFAISCGFVLVRLRETNQLAIIQSVGVSLSTVATSIIKVGIAVVAIIYMINFYLAPYSLRQFKNIQFNISHDIEHIFSKDGELAFENKIAIYIKKISNGNLYGIMIFDQRNPRQQVVLQADKGYIDQSTNCPKLLLENGERVSINLTPRSATRFKFKHYESDIPLKDLNDLNNRDLRSYERYIYELFDKGILENNNFLAKKMQAEGHQRIISPWLAIIFALVCFVVITSRQKFRHNSLVNIALIGIIITFIQGLNLGLFHLSHKYWEFNIVNYASIIAILGTLVLIIFRPSSK